MARSKVKYDLLGKLSENTELTRATLAKILTKINPGTFRKFEQNPEHFIAEASRLITEQKAAALVEHLAYNLTDQTHETSEIFTVNQMGQDFSRATEKLSKHVYDYLITDSKVEKEFAKNLEIHPEVLVYAKLPGNFSIPTPVGNYNPDWAIAFTQGDIKHIYFIAETKGSLSSLELRAVEKIKINCANKFFSTLAEKQDDPKVSYKVIKNYNELMDWVRQE